MAFNFLIIQQVEVGGESEGYCSAGERAKVLQSFSSDRRTMDETVACAPNNPLAS